MMDDIHKKLNGGRSAKEVSETEPPELKEWLLRTAEGEEAAFEKLALLYTEKVFTHTLSFVKSYPVAEEIVQDIFMRVWNNRKKLKEVENFDNYLFILSKNHLISVIRKKLVTVEALGRSEWEELSYRPDKQYDQKEIQHLLEAGINQLPEQKRIIFRLIHQEGCSQEKVAADLGIATRTVRWNLVSAMNLLREYIFHQTTGKLLLSLLLILPLFLK